MAFCKVCVCGEKLTSERRMGFKDNCPVCGRRLVEAQIYNEDDPQIEFIIKRITESIADNQTENYGICDENKEKESQLFEDITHQVRKKNSELLYALKLGDGREIPISKEGCIIGRTETGAVELAEYLSVSRQHLRVIVKRHIGVIVEDLSTYGTYINGKKLEKHLPKRVDIGAKILLCDVEATLVAKEINKDGSDGEVAERSDGLSGY